VLVTMVTAISLSVVTLAALVLGPELTGRPAAGATLVAVWGLGSLVGSLVVTWRPIRREPEVSTATHVMVIAVALVLCAVSPTYVWALVAFTVAGIANAPFVAATFAARSSYAPSAARAQVFVSVAGLKVAAAAAGTALGGLALARFTPPVVIALAAGATACAALAAVLDRRRGRR
jgi:predicted MFS family arabinose efflux permease